jgi:hypothetical protein
MFYIDQKNSEFLHAKQAHYTNIRYVIKKKLLGKKFTEPHPAALPQRIGQVTGIVSNVANFLNDETNLKNILIGTPEILDQLKSKFKTKKAIKSIKSIIRYDSFIDKDVDTTFRFYNAYNLAENLKQDTCIYCNRLYTHTIISTKKELIARPTFDHWFTKSEFPLLALSFYNLIPSCSVCNSSIKGNDNYSINDIFNPYLKHAKATQQLNFQFSFDLENHLTAKCKIRSQNAFTKKSIAAMKLAEMYNCHNEEIRELIYLKKAYSLSYLNSLKSILKTPISDKDVYRLAFGVYFDDDALNKRPLSKMKKDILSELGIIK